MLTSVYQESNNFQVKFVIYCAQLANGDGYSRHWINYKADLFTGPFETTCKTAIEKGMPKSKVKSMVLLLRSFYRNDNFTTEKKEAILSSMGINPTESFITLGTGANSSNNHLEIINALQLTSLDLKFKQIVALCGENEDLRNRLSSLQMNRKFKIIATPKTGAKIASLSLILLAFLLALEQACVLRLLHVERM